MRLYLSPLRPSIDRTLQTLLERLVLAIQLRALFFQRLLLRLELYFLLVLIPILEHILPRVGKRIFSQRTRNGRGVHGL